MTHILDTPRLSLREFNTSDAPFVLQLLNSEGWLKYIGDRKVKTVADAEQYIVNRLQQGYTSLGYGFWIVELKGTHTAIGMCGLVKRDSLSHTDIGFALLPEYEGKGFGYEMSSATLHYAKETLHIPVIVAITVSYNHACIALLEKLGLRFDSKIFVQGDDEELLLYTTEPAPQA